MQAYFRAIFGKCPHCGQGQLRKGLFSIHERCAVCGLEYETEEGDFLGALTVAYVVVVAITMAFAFALIYLTDLGPLPIICLGSVVIILATLALYGPSKGAWIATLYLIGWIKPPPPDERPAIEGPKN
jgi:uncharacterized protein (DUF983 family)